MEPKEEILKVFSELLNLLKQGVDLGVEQLPSLLNEILEYNLVMSTIGLTFAFILAGFVIYTIIRREYWWNGDSPRPLFPVIICIISLVSFCTNIKDVVQIIFAPRLYLIEYLSNLV